ncbi:flavin-containing monooxygenase [Pseudoroseicyclus sp. H15]
MAVERTDALVVGAGQAGIAMSEHLSRQGIEHLVLEKADVAEAWSSGRWDSLVTNGPVWHDCFPSMPFEGDTERFAPKEEVTEYFRRYTQMIGAPIRTGVEVQEAVPLKGQRGYRVTTSEGEIEARFVIAATGAFQVPVLPPLVPEDAVTQLHSSQYRNPGQLPEGGVLVVGGGASGAQIAEELLQAGRRVHLSLGEHDRPPRRYRGRDFVWWLGVLGYWDLHAKEGDSHVTIAVSGADGGRTVDFRRLAQEGMVLHGRTDRFEDGVMHFRPDLAANLAAGDQSYLKLLAEADAYIEEMGLDLPEEPEARQITPDPACVTEPVLALDLGKEGITSILWATGFKQDFSWLKVDSFDEAGKPRHSRGISKVPGIYFLGLPWQTRRGSSFIWGVWYDASYIADHIAKQRGYLDYETPRPQQERDPQRS